MTAEIDSHISTAINAPALNTELGSVIHFKSRYNFCLLTKKLHIYLMTSRFTFRMWTFSIISPDQRYIQSFQWNRTVNSCWNVWSKPQRAPTGAWCQTANALIHRDFHPDSAAHTGEQLSLLPAFSICSTHVWQLGSQHFLQGQNKTRAAQSSVLQPRVLQWVCRILYFSFKLSRIHILPKA